MLTNLLIPYDLILMIVKHHIIFGNLRQPFQALMTTCSWPGVLSTWAPYRAPWWSSPSASQRPPASSCWPPPACWRMTLAGGPSQQRSSAGQSEIDHSSCLFFAYSNISQDTKKNQIQPSVDIDIIVRDVAVYIPFIILPRDLDGNSFHGVLLHTVYFYSKPQSFIRLPGKNVIINC